MRADGYPHTQALGSLISLTFNFNKTGDQVEYIVAILLPRLLVSIEVSDSEGAFALIVLEFHQRDFSGLNLYSYSDSLAAIINILGLFIFFTLDM